MSDWELQERVAGLTNENAELKVLLMDALAALAASSPHGGSEAAYNQVVDRIIYALGLSDDEIRALLGN